MNPYTDHGIKPMLIGKEQPILMILILSMN